MTKPKVAPNSTINAGFYSYSRETRIGPAEDREFRRLLGWPPRGPLVDTSDTDKDLYAFFDQVNDTLNAHASLPDGDKAALRTSKVRDEARRLQSSLAALCGALEPSDDTSRATFEALLRVLDSVKWNRMTELQDELDEFGDALDAVVTKLAATSTQHGATNIAGKQTISDLERLFNAFVAKHETVNGRSKTALTLDRDEFVGVALKAAHLPVLSRYGDAD